MSDPSLPLAERIAREHHLTTHAKCACPDAIDAGRDAHAWVAHIATATERAVRERVAADIEAEANRRDPDEEDWPSDPSEAITAAGLRIAARIARGGTR